MRTAKTLIRMGGCPGWSESSLGAQVVLLVLSSGGSHYFSYIKRMEGYLWRLWALMGTLGLEKHLFSCGNTYFFNYAPNYSNITVLQYNTIWAMSWENLFYAYANNKGTDQPAHPCSLISTFVVRCLESIIPLVYISEISRLQLASVAAQAGLCLIWSQTPKTGFLMTRLIYYCKNKKNSDTRNNCWNHPKIRAVYFSR